MIFGGPYIGRENSNTQRNYAREVNDPPVVSFIVERAIKTQNELKRMLVDSGSSINVIFRVTFGKMEVVNELTSINSPLYGYTSYNMISSGKITLKIEMRSTHLTAHHFMKFLVVDNRSANHGALERPVLKALLAVMPIHHLFMKFSAKSGIAIK